MKKHTEVEKADREFSGRDDGETKDLQQEKKPSL